MGVPIVTWPGPFMRSRVTAGCYKQMGLQELIVSDAKEYVALALKLAHDPRYYAQMRAEIIANSDKLFHRSDVVQELEQVFAAAYALAQVIDVR